MVALLTQRPRNSTDSPLRPLKHASDVSITAISFKSMQFFAAEVDDLFTRSLRTSVFHALSVRLQAEMKKQAQSSQVSMLPSWLHALPSGNERGTFLALDVGGSNLRIALISLNGRQAPVQEQMEIIHCLNVPIDARVRALKGKAFFAWLADQIGQVLASDNHRRATLSDPDSPIKMGLAWSFPIEQTSARSGRLLAMGKGFSASDGVIGQDLSDLIMEPCRARRLNVQLQTLVNDSSATLLSQAYRESHTRMSLILGTGTNSSVYLPVSALAAAKYGPRPRSWHDNATHCLVNTELSMHGKSIWPRTRWDDALNVAHALPDYQPFEQLVGGRYMGEIARLIYADAVCEADFFDGQMPEGLEVPYSLDTELLAHLEQDTTPKLSVVDAKFTSKYRTSRRPRPAELAFIKRVAQLVSTRAAAYEAAAVHALWSLCCDEEVSAKHRARRLSHRCNGMELESSKTNGHSANGYSTHNGTTDKQHKAHRRTHSKTHNKTTDGVQNGNGVEIPRLSNDKMRMTIACDGSVIGKYECFRERCQEYLDRIVEYGAKLQTDGHATANGDGYRHENGYENCNGHTNGNGHSRPRLVELSMARESTLFGAAVAAACCA